MKHIPMNNIAKEDAAVTRLAIVCLCLSLGFTTAFIPMKLQLSASREAAGDLNRQLVKLRIRANLSAAIIDARRGEFELARKAASQFFTQLRTQMTEEHSSIFAPQECKELMKLLEPRDDIITMLARNEVDSAERLTKMFDKYRQATAGTVAAR